MTSRIGMIGLGLLGSAIAERLLSSSADQMVGNQILGFDLSDAARSRFQKLNGTIVSTVEEVLENSEILILSLPDDRIVYEVLKPRISCLIPETIILDTTTGDPDRMQQMGAMLNEQGIHYLDTTVGGSSQQVREGTAIIMAGGGEHLLESVRPILSTFAKEIFHMGPTGSGSRMKLVMNLVLGLNRAVLAEGLSFADKLDLDLETVLNVLAKSPASSKVIETKGEKMLTGDFTPQAKLSQHHKDVALILESAEKQGGSLPLSHLHEELLSQLIQQGYGDLDNSAIIKAFQ